MAEQNRPASPEVAPDPSRNYERSRPEDEAGMGRLDNNRATPEASPDKTPAAVGNKSGQRQLNAHEGVDARAANTPAPEQPQQSMKDEEPLGSDQVPQDIHDPRQKRHPRTEGKGGTP